MRPVLRLTARCCRCATSRPATTVGYNATWIARAPDPHRHRGVGYADGYHRSAVQPRWAFFDGARLPLIGRVSMDLTTFDATDHPAVVPAHGWS